MEVKKYKISHNKYDKNEFYRLMGPAFADKKIKKELPYLDNEEGRYWILILEKNQLIGFGSLQELKKKIIIKSAFVYPAFRGKGIYKWILDLRLKEAKKLNKVLETVVKKELTTIFQEKGFKVVRVTKNYSIMRKNSN
ncbi:MAG: GNAT family N-acetyltransferase [Candidatus Kariarchaeaceae archaeon]